MVKVKNSPVGADMSPPGAEEDDQVLLHDELSHSGQRSPQVSRCGVYLQGRLTSASPQVAVLCQFLREVDYMTAFKALQEQNR